MYRPELRGTYLLYKKKSGASTWLRHPKSCHPVRVAEAFRGAADGGILFADSHCPRAVVEPRRPAAMGAQEESP